jgi:hypothetical protein
MIHSDKTRFRKTEEALRFYFRVRELLHSGRPRRLLPDDLPSAACFNAANAVDDYQCIGWCMRGLPQAELWLLSELYGPTSFGVHRRTLAQACDAGRSTFPRCQFKLRQLSLIHHRALAVVRNRLRGLGLIPVFRSSAAGGDRRARSDQARPHFGHAAV